MKPNIIIVMTDQQRQDLRKSNGYALDTMPFLDTFAQEGVDFKKAYTPNPTCCPARVSMFTGRYAANHKVRTNHNRADALYTKDLLDVMKENGYHTALCGKNHSHHANDDFDYCEANGHVDMEGERNLTEREAAFDKFMLTNKHMSCEDPSPYGVEEQFPYRNVTSCFNFIDSTESNTPFFCWLSFAEPHNPYQVPHPYYDMFPPESLPELVATPEEIGQKGERFTWMKEAWERVIPEADYTRRLNRWRSNYHGMLRLIDDQFHRLCDGLKERNIYDNTIVIYLSDHGEFAGEYGLPRKGVDLPELLTHIPMLFRGPGITPQGAQTTHFTNIVDILPTLCDCIDAPVPFGCQGKSITPLLANKDIPKKEFDIAYSESGFSGLYWDNNDEFKLDDEIGFLLKTGRFDCLNTWSQSGDVRMIRKGAFKLQYDMMGTGYLYNVETDPFELTNLWANQDYISIQTDLLKELLAMTLRTSDPLPAPHVRYRTKVHPKGYSFQEFSASDNGVYKTDFLHTLCNHSN